MRIPALLTITLFLFSCGGKKEVADYSSIKKMPVHRLSNYTSLFSRPVVKRIVPAPEFVLKQLMQYDNAVDYTPYQPNDDEIYRITLNMRKLPPLNLRILRERCIAIYFVNNFRSNGLTDYAVDSAGNRYFYMAFNSQSLKISLSDLLTRKEQSCFKDDQSPLDVRILCSDEFKGFFYVLLHESTHGVDLVNNITPWLSPVYAQVLNDTATSTPFTKGMWKSYDIPEKNHDFDNRNLISFYGFDGGAKIPRSSIKNLYSFFQKSGFASLQSSVNWAQDIADFVTFYHLTHKLNNPYKIVITFSGQEALTIEPMNSAEVRKRFDSIAMFYWE